MNGRRFPITIENSSLAMKKSEVEWSPSTNIFLNYLPKSWTKQELVNVCAPFGNIQSAKVMIDLKTGVSRCFGFVRYSTLESAVDAVFHLNGWTTSGKRLMVRFAGKPENTGNPTTTIHIKSLPLTFTESTIWELYGIYGEIRSVFLETNPTTNQFRGSAYVTYRFMESATEAVRQTNNLKLGPEQWPLFVQYVQNPTIIRRDSSSRIQVSATTD
jgi:RNA recognition motif-containing protein